MKEPALVVEATVPLVEMAKTEPWEAFWTSKIEAALEEGKRVKVAPLTVRLPVEVSVPFNLVAPRTESVVEGLAVPMPTRFSGALTTKVVVSTTKL